jgi:hypothetical protein
MKERDRTDRQEGGGDRATRVGVPASASADQGTVLRVNVAALEEDKVLEIRLGEVFSDRGACVIREAKQIMAETEGEEIVFFVTACRTSTWITAIELR